MQSIVCSLFEISEVQPIFENHEVGSKIRLSMLFPKFIWRNPNESIFRYCHKKVLKDTIILSKLTKFVFEIN